MRSDHTERWRNFDLVLCWHLASGERRSDFRRRIVGDGLSSCESGGAVPAARQRVVGRLSAVTGDLLQHSLLTSSRLSGPIRDVMKWRRLYCAIGDPMKLLLAILVLVAMTVLSYGKVSKQPAGTADGREHSGSRASYPRGTRRCRRAPMPRTGDAQ